jgi:membrane-bound inhibitor of C-type lysozyme
MNYDTIVFREILFTFVGITNNNNVMTMKRFLFTALAFSAMLCSCGNNPQRSKSSTGAAADGIVRSSATDAHGVTLSMEFDNAQNTAVFVLAGDTILLRGDTTASGIRYSNEAYEFVEWHGEMTLRRDGEVVFERGL